MANISKILLPGAAEAYDIVDSGARTLIDELQKYTDYLGVTTTELTDGSTTNPITIDNKSVTAKKGNIVNYGSKEFIFNGTAWQEFGDLSALGTLAYKSSASGSYTPAGTVTSTFTGTEATLDVEVVAVGDVTIGTGSGTANYTPAGSISGTNVTLTTTTVNSITDVGTLPSATMPTYTVNNEVLEITAGTFSAGTLPTQGAATTVATGVDTVTDGSFSGTGVELTGSFSGSTATTTVTYTPAGTIASTFAGTAATVTVS